MNKIAIVTVDFNGHTLTLDFMKSAKILKTNGFEVKFIIVDNGSTEPFPGSEMENTFPGTEWLQTGRNLGFTGGYNFGMKYAYAWGADYVLIVNNDTEFGDPDMLIKLADIAKGNEKRGLISPKIYFAPGYEFYKQRYKESERGKVIWYAGGKFDWENVQVVHRGIDEVDIGKYDAVSKTEFASGCCLLISRKVLETVGYFNEKLFAYFEDAEYVAKVTEAGFEQWYAGNTFLYHKISQTAGVGSPVTDYLLTRNRLYFGMKYAGLRTKFALLRQAGGFLWSGRQKQKEAVGDFLRGKTGGAPWLPVNEEQKNFPLDVSIVVVNFKTHELTEQLLASIYNKISGFENLKGEIILLDNASDDGIGKIVAAKYPKVKFIQNSINTGFAKGNNQIIDYAKGKYILMFNSDIKVLPGSIKEMYDQAEKSGRAVVAGKLILPDGSIQRSCLPLPTLRGAIREYFGKQKNAYSAFAPAGKLPVKVEVAVMASFMIPRTVISLAGKLSEGTFMYFEDIEYCRRLKKYGVPIYYVPKAEFVHYHGMSSKKMGEKESEVLLKKGAVYFHGWFKYALLWIILWTGQKIKSR
jgi:GT2 family glycosyltransferase